MSKLTLDLTRQKVYNNCRRPILKNPPFNFDSRLSQGFKCKLQRKLAAFNRYRYPAENGMVYLNVNHFIRSKDPEIIALKTKTAAEHKKIRNASIIRRRHAINDLREIQRNCKTEEEIAAIEKKINIIVEIECEAEDEIDFIARSFKETMRRNLRLKIFDEWNFDRLAKNLIPDTLLNSILTKDKFKRPIPKPEEESSKDCDNGNSSSDTPIGSDVDSISSLTKSMSNLSLEDSIDIPETKEKTIINTFPRMITVCRSTQKVCVTFEVLIISLSHSLNFIDTSMVFEFQNLKLNLGFGFNINVYWHTLYSPDEIYDFIPNFNKYPQLNAVYILHDKAEFQKNNKSIFEYSLLFDFCMEIKSLIQKPFHNVIIDTKYNSSTICYYIEGRKCNYKQSVEDQIKTILVGRANSVKIGNCNNCIVRGLTFLIANSLILNNINNES
ncbi:hypothetical protein [Carp edema virus]|nr:hypothetical protein [Carp edema virus]